MRRRALLMSVAAVVLVGSNALAQAKANFAGTWTLVPDPNAAAGGGGGGGGGRGGGRGGLGMGGTITQDDKTLTITRTTQNGEVKSVYNLDGSESKNSVTMGGNAVETSSTAKWDGAKLVVVTSSNFNGNASQSTMALSLDASGNLTVETTAPGRGGGEPVTRTQNYKKG